MKLLLLPVVALAPSAFAAVLPRQETQSIQIVLQVDKIKDRAAIDVYNNDKSTLLAQSCSRTLQSADLNIAFEVGQNGGGTFTVGSQSYTVNDDIKISGGAICNRIVTNDEFVVNCVVPNSQPLSALTKRDLKTCFPEGPIHLVEVLESFETAAKNEDAIISAATVEAEAAAEAAAEAELQADLDAQNSALGKRQGSCGTWSSFVQRVDNGNPHQNPWNVQLSVPMQCDATRTCAIAYNSAKSFSIGWTASLSGGGWIDAGFAVTQTVETGTSHYCNGNVGDYFALWKNIGTTAYTVRRLTLNQCSSSVGPNYILWSPNKNDRFSEYYCVFGRDFVRNLGDRWLDTRDHMPWGP